MLPTELSGKYEERGTLGAGAMGTVVEAFDRLIERRVAVKLVRLPAGGDAEAEEAHARFRREAKAAGRLSHANIVAVHDYGENRDTAWIVMELVEGGSLKAVLDRGERLAVPEIARVMGEVLAALAYSHGRGVVHRDIKPANIMLTGEGGGLGTVKIADFGIARIESSTMTQVGTVMGTPSYMAPEQLRGEPVDARADIWAAGVVLYQLLTGEKPFEGNYTALMHRVMHSEPPPPSQLAVSVPRAFDAVLARALAKRPEDRFPTATAFAEAIRQAAMAPAAAPGPEPVGAFGFAGAGPLPGLDETTVVAGTRRADPPARPPPAPPPARQPAEPEPWKPGGLRRAVIAAVLLLASGYGAYHFATQSAVEDTPVVPPRVVATLPPGSEPPPAVDAPPGGGGAGAGPGPAATEPAVPSASDTPPGGGPAVPADTPSPGTSPPPPAASDPPSLPAGPPATASPSAPPAAPAGPPVATPSVPPAGPVSPPVATPSAPPSGPAGPPIATPSAPPSGPAGPPVATPSVPPAGPASPPVATPAVPPAGPAGPPIATPAVPPSGPVSPPVATPSVPPAGPVGPPIATPAVPPAGPVSPPVATPSVPPAGPAGPPIVTPSAPPAGPVGPSTPPVATTAEPGGGVKGPPPADPGPPAAPPAGPAIAALPPPITPPAAPPLPVVVPAVPRVDFRAAAEAVAATPCSLLEARGTDAGLTVSGLLRHGGEAEIRRLLDARNVPPAAAVLRLQPFDGPYCGALDLLRPIAVPEGQPPRVEIVGSQPLQRADLLRLDVQFPDRAGHFTVGYLMQSGEIAHLVPSQAHAAAARLRLGEPHPGFTGWEVDEPFGTDLILVIAADRPLFAQPRPQVERLEDYLAALAAVLRERRAQGLRVAARAVVVETVRKR